jgi:predicted metalloprotease with PDZ domain
MIKSLMGFFRGNAQRLMARIAFFTVVGFLCLAGAGNAEAQTLHVRISVVSVEPARIRIDTEFPQATNVLSFRNAYGGVLGLGERIEMVEAIRPNGESVRAQQLAPGEFKNAEAFARFKYEVNVTEPLRPAQMSHVSWVNREHGLLMLADLLPSATSNSGGFTTALISVDAPAGWMVTSNAKREGLQFSTDDLDNTVFLIGPAVQEKSHQLGANNLSIITSGKWPISDKDASKIAGTLIEEYSRITGVNLKRKAVLMLLPFPGEAGPESWTAETRGNDVVLLLGRKATRKRVLSRLGIVLTHELFHLWVPNSLKLAGDYDWFFEGFTLYQALRMALRLGLISFDDYLATIARVYDSYLSSVDHDSLSLITASERRWTTAAPLVYEQGMLVAFLYDLLLRSLSDCRASLDDVYRGLFRLPATGHGNANEIIIKLLSEPSGLESFGKDYIENAGKIELDSAVSTYGVQVERGNTGTRLAVSREPNKAQRKLLRCIGYRR